VRFQAPVVAPPLAPAATGFDFDVRTNEFAAVNAYYHPDEFFAELEALALIVRRILTALPSRFASITAAWVQTATPSTPLWRQRRRRHRLRCLRP